MRVNIYNEELTDRVEEARAEANSVTFHGVRFFVGKPFEHTPGDDDSPAVTFWFSDEYGRGCLRSAFQKALEILDRTATQS